MGFFSNQASIEARISASRLAGFIDHDNDTTPDAAALAAGIEAAHGLICSYIGRDYDHDTIDAWDIAADTVPELIAKISDDLCIPIYYAHNPRFQEPAQTMAELAEAMLVKIRNGEMDIYGVDRVTSYINNAIVTGRVPSDFDPERALDDMTVSPYWNRPDARDLEGY